MQNKNCNLILNKVYSLKMSMLCPFNQPHVCSSGSKQDLVYPLQLSSLGDHTDSQIHPHILPPGYSDTPYTIQ